MSRELTSTYEKLRQHTMPGIVSISLWAWIPADTRHDTRTFDITWQFWRKTGNPQNDNWGPIHSSAEYDHAGQAMEDFQMAIGRVTTLILAGKPIPIDIMHDYEQVIE